MYTQPAAEAPVTLRAPDGRLLIAVLDPDTTSSPLRRALAHLRDHSADQPGQGT
ncbi:hypothetical protein [Streptomyces sp. NPDC087297]|uniref:hypothetical protein n=1 Tax=Streptomyces sp. NPDC087297 TaxID=3365778 RepID=UPI0037F608F9